MSYLSRNEKNYPFIYVYIKLKIIYNKFFIKSNFFPISSDITLRRGRYLVLSVMIKDVYLILILSEKGGKSFNQS